MDFNLPHRTNNDTHRTQLNNTPIARASQSSLPSTPPSTAPTTHPHPLASSNTSQHHPDPLVTSSSSRPVQKRRFFPLSRSSTPRSSPLSRMGQGPSQTAVEEPLPSNTTATGSTNRLKRAFVGRRKKSESTSSIVKPNDKVVQVEGRNSGVAINPPFNEVLLLNEKLKCAPPLQDVYDEKVPQPLVTTRPHSPSLDPHPPTPPPKGSPTLPALPDEAAEPTTTGRSLINQVSNSSLQPSAAETHPPDPPQNLSPSKVKPDDETKRDWRRSDSTMIGHGTIRPGFGNRSPRPVSFAESSHSGHTVVPTSRPLSALITDAEFAMPEEGDAPSLDSERKLRRLGPDALSEAKSRNRRSMSLNFGVGFGQWSKPANPGASVLTSVGTTVDGSHHCSPFAGFAAGEASIHRTMATDSNVSLVSQQSSGGNLRSKIAAWTSGAPWSDRNVPRRTASPYPPYDISTTQSTPSVHTNLSPAAGKAIGIGKRAAEKVHRVWGGLSSSSSSHSSHSSGSGAANALYQSSQLSSEAVNRSVSDVSASNVVMFSAKGKRKTPNASSGSWSVTSSVANASLSDSGSSFTTSPSLGTCLRGPKRLATGGYAHGGLVFGRDLGECVRATGISQSRYVRTRPESEGVPRLEERMIPALVVRCVQHLTIWGVHEEGLFRVNGRASHISKLRAEFDSGADYNLAESDPSDLDPHAVASVFKAYLRELPQSILTSALIPHFEGVMAAERSSEDSNPGVSNVPSNAGMLRKPPSLSTLAIPSFAGKRTLSDNTIQSLSSLVSLLPDENKDLLVTVVELIQATASRSQDTKMPLGNLLLVFCPSLNMSPSLLRVLCETPVLWAPPPPRKNDEDSQVNSLISENSQDSSGRNHQEEVLIINNTSPDESPNASQLLVPSESELRLSDASTTSVDDTASYLSALDVVPQSVSRSSSPKIPQLCSSSDSLATPSTLSENPSISDSSNLRGSEGPNFHDEKSGVVVAVEDPTIVDSHELSLPRVSRRPTISSPVPFPSTGGAVSRSPTSSRKSFLLSFPPLRSDSSLASSSSSSSGNGRPHRTSLRLLFTKKSTSSITSPATAPISPPSSFGAHMLPRSASANPLSPDSRFRTSLPSTPPKLDTPVSSSPIRHQLQDSFPDICFDTEEGLDSDELADIVPQSRLLIPGAKAAPRVQSFVSSIYATPQLTPTRGSVSSGIYNADKEPSPISQLPSATPSLEFAYDNEVVDDWAQSVLDAAGANS